jgi:hypothetical protein
LEVIYDDIEVDRGPTPLISTSFTVGGDEFDASEFSNLIETQPIKIWRQKREDLRNRPDLHNFEWIYEINKKPLWSMGETITEVLEIFWPKRNKIISFCEKNKLSTSIDCSIYIEGPIEDLNPEFCLYPNLIQKLADLKAEFGMFIY